MPTIGDVIKTSFQSELSSVAILNDITWRVLDLGANPGNLASLIAITDAYHLAWTVPTVTGISISCAIYENLTASEGKEVSFPSGKTGTIITPPHPQDQVIRYSEYTAKQFNLTLKRGGYNLTGTAESLSTNGLINNVASFEALRKFLMDELTLGAGWTIQPVQRFQSTRGQHTLTGPDATLTDIFQSFTTDELVGRDVFNDTDGSKGLITANSATTITALLAGGINNAWNLANHYHVVPANFATSDIIQCVLGATYRKLASRKTKLCQVL